MRSIHFAFIVFISICFCLLHIKNISILFAVNSYIAPEREKAIRALIEHGANVFAENLNKQTPRQKAELEGDISLCV